MATQGERNKVAFHEGVCLLMSTWTVMKLAVENEFGGYKSREKADWLIETIMESFEKKKGIEVDFLEDLLDDVLQGEFNTIAEDGSIPEVANQIMNLFRQCVHGDYSGVEALRARAPTLQRGAQQSVRQAAVNPSDDEDSESEDEDDDEMTTEGAPSSSSSFGQQQQLPVGMTEGGSAVAGMGMDVEMEMDAEEEDGWETVGKKAKKTTRKH